MARGSSGPSAGPSQAGPRPPGGPSAAGRGRGAPGSHLEAFVLHRYDWSESSLILDLFTRERGRVAVAAKGAKRPYSQLRPVLLPFQRLQVALGRSAVDEQAELHTLRHAEWAGGGPMLSGSALFSGFYLNELLMKLLARHDPHPGLFDAYRATLPTLASVHEGVAQAGLRGFELLLLRETGLLPDLATVTQTQRPVEAGAAYRLVPETGVVATHDEAPALPGGLLLGLQAALDQGDLAALQTACAPAGTALRVGLRALLHYHLGTPVLRTRQVLQSVQRLIDPTPTPSR